MADLTFRAMASPCRVIVHGCEDDVATSVRRLIDELEARWSRFLPDSEVSWLNRTAGRPAMASNQTVDLLRRALYASVHTDGLFNPFLLDELEAFGYDQSHAERREFPDIDPANGGLDAFEHPVSVVELAQGMRFDPGGIGKGYAADLAARHAIDAGATRAAIVLGGDVRLAGAHPAEGTEIEVKDPFDPDQVIASVRMSTGAVATSSTLRRRWRDSNGEERHHLLDPRTRRPSTTDLVAATVIAGDTWWAEALAKAAVIGGSENADELLRRHGATGLLVGSDRNLTVVGDDRRVVAA